MIMVLLIIVSAVIIALIVYTLTMDKVRSIATLKFVGAPDRTIVGLIVQQALSMGIFGYFIGLALVLIFKPYFPTAAGARLRKHRRRVRRHGRDLPCRQHAGYPARAQGGPGRSPREFGVGRWPTPANRRSCASNTCPSILGGDRTRQCAGRHQHGGLSRPGRRSDGPERFGQDHAAQLHRLHPAAEQRAHHARRRGGL